MENIKTADLKPGMVTAASVKTKRGQELIPVGTTLTKQLISRIEFYSIDSAYIDEASILTEEEIQSAIKAAMAEKLGHSTTEAKETEPESKPEITTPKNEVAYSQKVKRSKTFQEYSLHSTMVTHVLKEQLEGFVFEKKPLDFETLLSSVKSLITPGQTVIQYFDMLHNLRSSDDSVYSHSLNVAMISRILGKWLKWSSSDLDSLVLAGLLHDIGKITIPPEILNKEGKLTDEEFEQIRWHPRAGYELIRDLKIDSRIKKATLQHHERCDGSGYPMKVDEIMLDDFAMVVAIADVYDAMTAARKYRAPLCPFQVIREFERDGYHKYKTEFLLTFLRHIATTYQNNRVILSDGQAAKIILLNQNSLSDPLVQLNDGSCIDLATSPLYIQSIV
ncbi:MAG: HD domain-containing protein [Lachnospiraceae bacterium]|nr:HD domain-containing protein [Lachnospiraceae bacterium]MDD7179036.1 HD domain-containing protein [bacterium]MDY5516287.1 HD domain-containing protein [Lachnospiraceae bacterium]